MIDQPETEESPASPRLRVWRVFVALSVIAALPTLLAFGARRHWILELMTHMRVQYVIAMVPVLAVSLFRRNWWLAAMSGLVLLFNLWLVAPSWFSGNEPAPDAPSSRVVVANVHTSNRRYDRFLELIREEKPKFFLVVEVDDRWVDALKPLRATYPYSVSKTRSDNFGIALYSRIPLEDPKVIELGDSTLPAIVARLRLNGVMTTVVGIHTLPPSSADYARTRNSQLRALPGLIAELNGPVMLLGDINTSPWSPYFQDLIDSTGLRDSRRGFGVQATWPTSNPLLRTPIDHAFVSREFTVIDRRIGPDIGSDHFPVIIDIAIKRHVD